MLPRFIVGRAEAVSAEAMGLGLIKLGWFSGEAQTAGAGRHFV